MITVNEQDIDKITEVFYLLLKGKKPAPIKLPDNYPDNEIKQVVGYANRFIDVYNHISDLTSTLSMGELDIEIPRGSLSFLQSLKTLRANLLHLTWTTQQIASGNFGLKVDFMGDFSKAFNSMAEQLEKLFLERKKNAEKLYEQIDELVMTRRAMHDVMKDLRAAREKAEHTEKIKSDFFSTMSHEIRTPMNSIIGYIELAMHMDPASRETQNYLRIAKHSAENILSITNDILDINKMEAGRLEIEKRAFYLPKLLENTLEFFHPIARTKYIKLALTPLNADLDVCIVGDSNRLRQILLNLIDNAIKFTPENGAIILSVKILKDNFLQISVEDTGIGISPKQMAKIFEPFSQADRSTARRFGGTGLGTNICKQLVELMGGRIWLESEPDKGSTFYFTMPFLRADCKSDCNEACKQFPGKEKKRLINTTRTFNILMAEDIEENATLVKIRLCRQGHKVFVAVNGREAVREFQTHTYDLILMDSHMPEMNGIEATQKIRSLESESGKRPRIPIIALTADTGQREKKAYLDAGMNAVVTKPIRFEKLFSIIENIIPQAPGNTASYPDTAPLPQPDKEVLSDLKGIAYDQGLEIWEDKDIYVEALQSFIDKYDNTPEILKNFIADKSTYKAHELSHALKGLAGNLYITEVEKIAAEIDTALREKKHDKATQWLPDLDDAIQTAKQSIVRLQLSETATGSPELGTQVGPQQSPKES